MGQLWNRSSSLEWDDNGVLAEGAEAFFFEAGTSTPKAVYSDGGESTPHEHPVEADGARWPGVFIPFGSYKLIIKTAGGTTLFSEDNIPNPEPFDETFEVDEDAQYQTGDYIFVGKNGTRPGAVRCNKRTIGDASSNATERANADAADLFAYIWDNYANGQCAIYDSAGVASTRGATAAADFAAHKAIATPDHRNAQIIGFGDMGNTDAGLAASAPVVSGSPIIAGSIIGANTHTLSTAETPAHTHSFSATSDAGGSHTHSFSATSGTESADHTHTGTTSSGGGSHTHNMGTTVATTTTADGSAYTALAAGAGSANTGNGSADHTHTFTSDGKSATHTHSVSGTTGAEATHTHSVSGTTGSTGGAGLHNNLSRAIPVTVLMKL